MLTYEEKIAILMAMCCVIGADGEFQPEEKTLRGKMMIYLDLYHNIKSYLVFYFRSNNH